MKLRKTSETNWKIIFILIAIFFALGGLFFIWSKIVEKEADLPDYSLKIEKKYDFPVYLDFFEKAKNDLVLEKKNFLEVNLGEMKVYLYKEGTLSKDFSILIKGDSQNWGGSAVGLYDILSGNELGYSVISDVYMPSSLRYYGKYYLHGQPYYSDGKILDTPISGGCLRLSNEDAGTIYHEAEIGMPILVIDKKKDDYEYVQKNLSGFPDISAESYLVADLDSGYVFAEENSQTQRPLASVTKLMTAIVVSENIDLRKSVTIQEKMLEPYGDTEMLEIGKKFSIVELFYPLLIESSNDTAEALTYFLGHQGTIKKMNEKAQAILMKDTFFEDPSGLSSKNVSTARDLFYLGRYLFNNRPPILEITKGNEVRSFGEINFDIEDLRNKNIFIYDETFVGGKTGWITESKNTALFIFRFIDKDGEERNIAIIILGSESGKTDTQKIYIWLQKNYFGDD